MTYYMCVSCRNTDRFKANQDYTEWGTEEITIDGYGETIDWGDRDSNDSEITDGPNDIECLECDSNDIEEYDTEEERNERLLELESEEGIDDEEYSGKTIKVNNWKNKLGGI